MPLKSPSLADYPRCDEEVNRLADALWGDCNGKDVKEHACGKGQIVCGTTPDELLQKMAVPPDFTADRPLRYIHRAVGDVDLYFVANPNPEEFETKCMFRVCGKPPELWLPDSGRIETPAAYEEKGDRTQVPLRFDPHGSLFVVFRAGKSTAAGKKSVVEAPSPVQPLEIAGPWEVRFAPDRGAAEKAGNQAMQVQFVGCGDAFGSGGRSNTCFHVTGQSVNFLIDCGASSLPALKRLNIVRDEIDLVLITHFHGDHFAGLPFLLLDAQFTQRTRQLVIAGPKGIEMRLTQVMEALFENSSKTQRRFELSVVALEPERPQNFGAITVTPFPVIHGDSGGPFLAYGSRPKAASSPTAPTPNGRRSWFRPRARPICSSPRRILRKGREEPPQPGHAGGASFRDQAEAAGADPYERRHAGNAG